MSIRFPSQEKVEEMKAFLKKENDRPQYEHDADMRQAMKEARRRLSGVV